MLRGSSGPCHTCSRADRVSLGGRRPATTAPLQTDNPEGFQLASLPTLLPPATAWNYRVPALDNKALRLVRSGYAKSAFNTGVWMQC